MTTAPLLRKWRDQRGSTLIEILVVLATAAFVTIAAMRLLTMVQFTREDLSDLGDARQAARVALAQVQRDLQVAGVGLTWLRAGFPLILPRSDGGVDLRSSPSGISTHLTDDAKKSNELEVKSAAGFAVGDTIVVYDASGSLEVHEIAGIKGNKVQLVAKLDNEFTVADGTAVIPYETVSYWLDTSGAFDGLIREVNGEQSVLAVGLAEFNVTYFDEDGDAFTPATEAAQLRIRSVGVNLQTQTARTAIQGEDRRRYELSTRVAPRTITAASR
jgi:type II secretory pathway pseudopilin PulG